MWDLRMELPFGRTSTRKMLAYAATLFAAVFAFILLLAPTTAHAATDASWNGSSITYQNGQYTGPSSPPDTGIPGVPTNAKLYTSVDSPKDGSDTQKAHLIYFDANTDPAKANSATYVEYDFTPPNTYVNAANKHAISIDPSGYNKSTTQCAVEKIGWLVCPVSNFLGNAMDWVFDTLRTFVEVKPLGVSQEGSLYAGWDVMRGFANVMFIIGFIVVIYSQLTSIGLSNYGVKKMLPRLIIAAILVNISYYICAVAIDLSNIVGMSLQDILVGLRHQISSAAHVSDNSISWSSLVTFIVSGGTAAGIGISAALAATGGTVLGVVYALVPVLIGLFLTVLMVLIILAARQAIIIMLVIIAPLAFVAYLLPGTEKWFRKWHETFTTMLVFFPAFSLIFGGSQLAGGIIIQNAQSVVMVLFGMAVQIAPLAVVPLILRLSSGVLGRIAGLVNDPRKGLADRVKNRAKTKQEMHAARGISDPNLSRRNFLRRAARRQAMGNRSTQRRTEAYKQGFEEYAAKKMATDKIMQEVELQLKLSKVRTEGWENKSKQAFEEARAGSTRSLRELQELGEGQGIITRSRTNAAENIRRRIGQPTRYDDMALDALSRAASAADQEARITSSAIHMAEHEQQQHYAKAMLNNQTLQERAGGISEHGADSALASAIAAQRKAYGEAVSEAHQIIKHLNLSGDQRQTLATKGDLQVFNDKGDLIKTFTTDSIYAREAAIEAQMRGQGNYNQIMEIIEASGSTLAEFRTTIGDEIAANKLTEKAAFLGGQTINQVKQGDIKSAADMDLAVARTIAQGKIKPSQLATMDVDAVRRVLNVSLESKNLANAGQLEAFGQEITKLQQQVAILGQSAHTALTNPALKGSVAQNVTPLLEQFEREWPPDTNS